MRALFISLGAVVVLSLNSCSTCKVDVPCEPKMCTIPSGLVGMDHASAEAALTAAGFTKHPSCHNPLGKSCHDTSMVFCEDGWLVDKAVPDSGTYDCSTIVDLTFAPPKKGAMLKMMESRPVNLSPR